MVHCSLSNDLIFLDELRGVADDDERRDGDDDEVVGSLKGR
jgi:hypothetical protein